jgi:hypothetical protein
MWYALFSWILSLGLNFWICNIYQHKYIFFFVFLFNWIHVHLNVFDAFLPTRTTFLTGGSKTIQVLAQKSSIPAQTEKIFWFCMDNGVTKIARRKKVTWLRRFMQFLKEKLHTNLTSYESLTSLLSIPTVFTEN